MTDAEALKVAIEACRFFSGFDMEREPASARAFYLRAKEAAARLERLAPFMERLVAGVKDEAKWLEEWAGGPDKAAYRACAKRLRALSTEETTKP